MAKGEDPTTIVERAWRRLWPSADAAAMRGVFEALVAEYSRPQRHYHNLRHVADCLRELEPVQQACEQPGAVRAALLFHDVVYDPTRSDNEERSAASADETLHAA